MYVLHHHPYSQHARRVVALLDEVGLDYRLVPVSFDTGEYLSPAYRAINPNHQVPSFQDGSLRIHESNAILRYLCNKHGLEDWYPSAPARRAEVDQWLDWNQCRLSPVVVDIVLNSLFAGPKADKAALARGKEKLPELAEILAAALEVRPFVAGDRPTIADLSLASNIFQLSLAKAAPLDGATGDWFERMSRLEGVRRSLPAAA